MRTGTMALRWQEAISHKGLSLVTNIFCSVFLYEQLLHDWQAPLVTAIVSLVEPFLPACFASPSLLAIAVNLFSPCRCCMIDLLVHLILVSYGVEN